MAEMRGVLHRPVSCDATVHMLVRGDCLAKEKYRISKSGGDQDEVRARSGVNVVLTPSYAASGGDLAG